MTIAATSCYVMVCDGEGCGTKYGEDWEGTVHFDSITEAIQYTRDGDWQIVGGQHYCPDCDIPETPEAAEAAEASADELARVPGPNDVPLFEVPA